jgi:hypothetical protein
MDFALNNQTCGTKIYILQVTTMIAAMTTAAGSASAL